MGARGPHCGYDPAMCQQVIDWGKQGKSLMWIAAEIGVVRQTIHNWIAQFPEFAEAMERAKQESQRWWEDAGQEGMTTPGFNASIWSRSVAARFPEDWREVRGSELTGPGGGPIQTTTKIERTIVDPANTDR